MGTASPSPSPPHSLTHWPSSHHGAAQYRGLEAGSTVCVVAACVGTPASCPAPRWELSPTPAAWNSVLLSVSTHHKAQSLFPRLKPSQLKSSKPLGAGVTPPPVDERDRSSREGNARGCTPTPGDLRQSGGERRGMNSPAALSQGGVGSWFKSPSCPSWALT